MFWLFFPSVNYQLIFFWNFEWFFLPITALWTFQIVSIKMNAKLFMIFKLHIRIWWGQGDGGNGRLFKIIIETSVLQFRLRIAYWNQLNNILQKLTMPIDPPRERERETQSGQNTSTVNRSDYEFEYMRVFTVRSIMSIIRVNFRYFATMKCSVDNTQCAQCTHAH